jgi:hypothetical protein
MHRRFPNQKQTTYYIDKYSSYHEVTNDKVLFHLMKVPGIVWFNFQEQHNQINIIEDLYSPGTPLDKPFLPPLAIQALQKHTTFFTPQNEIKIASITSHIEAEIGFYK